MKPNILPIIIGIVTELHFSPLDLSSSSEAFVPGSRPRVTLGLVGWVGGTWWNLGPAGAVCELAPACLPGLWSAVLPRLAHCVQLQTPHYRSDAAKLEAVQRRAVRAMWGGGGLALVLAAGGREQSQGQGWSLAQQGSAGNLRSAASVHQRLENGPLQQRKK